VSEQNSPGGAKPLLLLRYFACHLSNLCNAHAPTHPRLSSTPAPVQPTREVYDSIVVDPNLQLDDEVLRLRQAIYKSEFRWVD